MLNCKLPCAAQKAGVGKRPLEAWQAVIDELGMDATAAQLYAESEPLLTDKYVHLLIIVVKARIDRACKVAMSMSGWLALGVGWAQRVTLQYTSWNERRPRASLRPLTSDLAKL